jgi:hypothetical protein
LIVETVVFFPASRRGVTDVMGRSRGWLNAASPLKAPTPANQAPTIPLDRDNPVDDSPRRPATAALERLRKAGTKPWGSTVLASVICWPPDRSLDLQTPPCGDPEGLAVARRRPLALVD